MSAKHEFKTVAEFLSDPERWHKGYFAVTKEKQEVNTYHPKACAWCFLGAYYMVYGNDFNARQRVFALEAQLGGQSIAEWNDDPKTTHEDVLRFAKENNL